MIERASPAGWLMMLTFKDSSLLRQCCYSEGILDAMGSFLHVHSSIPPGQRQAGSALDQVVVQERQVAPKRA